MSWWLAIAYAAVAALLLNLGLRSRWPFVVKLGAVVVVSALYVGTFLGLRSQEGWPTTVEIDDRFRLEAAIVDEPDPTRDTDGAVFYWVRILDEQGETQGPPRAYRRDFTPEEANRARAANELLRRGVPVEGRLTTLDEGTELTPSNSPTRRRVDEDEALQFEAMAVPSLPPKPSR